ncbi:uncharacterized protein LOC121962450 [Plectropomus leopardus]|uniref:uncharacterized protein LOC121962450 n=1 Tax=Plectropomus leopardus TaxID=160734 RepID=UPI001C4B8960|nr:uncharacterized protein LOC121962450 [Plectropomus leopardus]
MGHTSLCVLGLFLLNLLLHCGHAQDAVLTIEPNWSTFFTGESLTFMCDVRVGEDTDWFYTIKRNSQEFLLYSLDKRYTLLSPTTGYSGEYQCFGDQKRSPNRKIESNKVSLSISEKDVILESPASNLFEGESVTLRCRHRDQTKEKEATFYKAGSPLETDKKHPSLLKSKNTVQIMSDGSSYMCKYEDEESEPIQLKMEPRPKANLRKNVLAGGRVALTCSLSTSSSSGWKYFWYRGNTASEPLTAQDAVFLTNETISVPQGGLYWCRGGRGEPVYYTEYSDSVVTNRAVVTLRPKWPEIFYLETITLTCEIEDGGDAEWEYEWTTFNSYIPEQKEYTTKTLANGKYWCKGRLKGQKASTEWSNVFEFRASDIPRPVLTVSPSWLSPGASVTLNCSVKDPTAGWSFFWYKAVPRLSDSDRFFFELLPDSSNGTKQYSYIIYGQTHTGGYACRAGRGDPVYYTLYSEPKFVWCGDCHSEVSLTVSPDRVQHFREVPISLSCEGNSTQWRVSRFSESGYLTDCSSWGTMTGSTCNMNLYWLSGTYWCESKTGQFSNAVNITVQYGDIILVSPAHPVTEGDSVTLCCKFRTQDVLYDVDFYKNNILIQNVTGEKLTISPVSTSDEGLYKCTGKKSTRDRQIWMSEESWMSVKSSGLKQSSLFSIPLIVGAVSGVLLFILLLLFLYCYRTLKGSCFTRSQGTNQGPATEHMINQDETQPKEYASHLYGDVALYESIKGSEEPVYDETKDATYSTVELKTIAEKGREKEPEESAVYSDVDADDNLMYAQVLSQAKPKKDKGKTSPEASDETVYSEVKPGRALGNNTAISALEVRMGLALLCVLSLFLLNTLLDCGHAEDAELTIEPNSSYLFTGEYVTFTCDMKIQRHTDWLYTFNWNDQQIVSFSANNWHSLNLTADLSGNYHCIGHHKGSPDLTKRSNNVTLLVEAQRPTASLRASRTAIPKGGSLTLTCSVMGSTGWKYKWFRRISDSTEAIIIKDDVEKINILQSGIYRCQGGRGKPVFLTEYSNEFRAEISLPSRVSVTLQHSWTEIYSGETITVICKIKTGGDTEWEYEWRTTSSNAPPTHREYRISSVSVFHRGLYWCKGRRDPYSSTEWSGPLRLTVSAHKPKPMVSTDRRTIPDGSNQTLTCSVDASTGWKHYWFRRASVFSESQIIRYGEPDSVISISQGGIYHCRGGRGNPVFFTEDSDPVIIEKRVSNKAVVSLQPNWPLIFSGETITVRCDISGSRDTAWEYGWSKPNLNTVPTHNEYTISSAAVSNSGNYRCMGKQKQDLYSSTEWSNVITLTVSSHKPKAILSADSRAFPAGGSVTLTCSVNSSSSGWRYYWFEGETSSEYLTRQDGVVISNEQIRVSQEGLYRCIGGRGSPYYYTEYSDSVSIHKIVTNGAVVTMQPNWPKIYYGETITLRCEIQGGDAMWEYEWMTTSYFQLPNQNEYRISSASSSHSGNYWCKGRLKRAQQNSTGWSISFELISSYDTPQPELAVSPLWLSPGAPVTLNCSVDYPSAGWRFFWYRAVPKLSNMYVPYGRYGGEFDWMGYLATHNFYNYELLPGCTNGTEQDFYIVYGQMHTAGYVCRAGRGDPVFYTPYSEPKFVWSGDVHSSASLTVSPDRVQHFTDDHISLSCEGNLTNWRIKGCSQGRPCSYLTYCSSSRRMSGSTCNINSHQHRLQDAVYWCESGSGELSNAVNITVHYDIILVSPVHPVTEGDSVTLGCKSKEGTLDFNAQFYRNNDLIQSDTKGELNISAVSKSDEGFYRCQSSGRMSPQSWMSVKSSGSSFSVPMIAGLVSGIIVVVLLLLVLLSWYQKSKDACCCRPIQSQKTSQSSANIQSVNQAENQEQLYSSLLHGDVCVYETVAGSGNTGSGERADEFRNVISKIQLKGNGKRRRRDEAAESSDYDNVN